MMKRVLGAIGRTVRSLYARIALTYLVSLVVLSVAVAWIAIHQFDQLGTEMRQRAQMDLARQLTEVMRRPLRQGVHSEAANKIANRITAINPALSLYVLNDNARVLINYGPADCGVGERLNSKPIHRFLSLAPMLPIYIKPPCGDQVHVFSVARIRYGSKQQSGYLLAVLGDPSQAGMMEMLRTSSITRTLVIAAGLALVLSAALGLGLFALLTRRLSRLTTAVDRLAVGKHKERINPGPDDELGRLARAFNDMAARLDAQMSALYENDRQRRELIANLSHDFRTPLTSLRGYADQLASDTVLDDDERRACVEAINTNTARLTRLAHQLSTLAHVDAFEQPLSEEVFALAELVSDVIGKFRADAEHRSVELVMEVPENISPVRADLALIDRALTNLIENALAATGRGDRVLVELASAKGHVSVSVVDNGAGIAEDELTLVTQRFYRGSRASERAAGSGLGLAIVADICERHGTHLAIDSAPGRGSRFSFVLRAA